MKKKGLIISTIVMVVVLVASLTTATYAWFNTSSVTKIDAFSVSVKTNNAVKIGVKADNTYEGTPTEDMFKTGGVTYTAGTAGTLGGGTWAGEVGLSASLDHNIEWGEQAKAIGFADTALTSEQIAAGGVASTLGIGALAADHDAYVYAANGDAAGTSATLTNVSAAIANNDGAVSPYVPTSDYVYLFLGVAPTRALDSSELIILVDGNATNSGTTLGILAAIHVAYRLNNNVDSETPANTGKWIDIDVFGQASKGYGDLKSSVTCNLTTGNGSEAATYLATYGSAAPTAGAYAVKITGLETTINTIDQVELLIYIDGSDTDCRQSAISNVAGSISIFFHTVDET